MEGAHMLPSQTRSDSFRVTDEPPASVPVMETESSSPGHHATKRPSATLAVTVQLPGETPVSV